MVNFKTTRRRVVTLVGLLSLGACGWVDSTGRQSNTVPDIMLDDSNVVVENSRLKWPLYAFDLDGNLSSVSFEPIASGEAVVACQSEFEPLSIAPTLREACQPKLSDEECQVLVEMGGREVTVSIPALRRPAALSFDVRVQDEAGATASSRVDFCIASVSEPPTAEPDPDYAVTYLEDVQHSGTNYDELCQSLGGTGVLANDSDDFDYTEGWSSGEGCLRVELVTSPSYAAAFELRADGGFSYQSSGAAGPGAQDSFSYRVSDGRNTSETATATILITGENNPPLALNPVFQALEDDVVELSVQELARDPEGGALRVESFKSPSVGELSLEGELLRFVPASQFHGSTGFDVTVADASGLQVESRVSVQIQEINDKPVIEGLPELLRIDVGDESQSRQFQWSFTVTDEETPASLLLIASQIDNGIVEHRLEGPSPEGEVTMTLTAIKDGSAVLTLQAIDQALGSLEAQRTVLSIPVTVVGVNKRPVAMDDTVELFKNANVTAQVLDNDSDPDGDQRDLRIVQILEQPSQGSVTIMESGRALQYQSDTQSAGVDVLRYQIEDAEGAVADAQLHITTTNRAPRVKNDSYRMSDSDVASFDVLSNDTDPDGDALELVLIEGGYLGTAAVINGRIRYRPSIVTQGTVRIRYEARDGDGGSATGELSVVVVHNDSGR